MEELVNNEPVIKPEEVDTDATTATEVVATEATEQVQPVEQPTEVAEWKQNLRQRLNSRWKQNLRQRLNL